MDVGVAFNPASTLELRNPDNLQEMAVNTKVRVGGSAEFMKHFFMLQ